jgi:hypothetical protein
MPFGPEFNFEPILRYVRLWLLAIQRKGSLNSERTMSQGFMIDHDSD